MKKLYLISLTLCYYSLIIASPLKSSESSDLFNHLVEVNKEWSHQQTEGLDLCEMVTFLNEKERIRTHLNLVIKILRQREMFHLSETQQIRRANQLNVLETYAKRGLFPKNYFHLNRQPYFVDIHGTACAVGYLIKESGDSELVQKIARLQNYAYVRELNYPELKDWAEHYGFTVEELAWIQPGYPPQQHGFYSVGAGEGFDGPVSTMLATEDLLFFAGSFSEVDGVFSNNIVAFNGNEWISIPNSLQGNIKEMVYHNDLLYVGGLFTLGGDICNIASWDGENWTALQSGSMQGFVNSLAIINNQLIIGGSFGVVNGEEMDNLAIWNIANQNWHNEDGVFKSNGTVNDILIENGKTFVGGAFTTVNYFPNETPVNYFAIWENDSWYTIEGAENEEVLSLGYFENRLILGCKEVFYYYSDQWYDFSFDIFDETWIAEDVNFLTFDDQYILYGDVTNGSGIVGQGLLHMDVYEEYFGVSGAASFNLPVRAAAVFQNELYLTGEFTGVNNYTFNGVTKTMLMPPTSIVEQMESIPVTITRQQDFLVITYESLRETTFLELFNVNGQLIERKSIPLGSGSITLSTSAWAEGAYFYRVQNSNGFASGKLMVF